MDASKHTLQLNDLSFSYPGVPVFSDINLSVELTGLTQVVGPNGGGKSTLAKLIMGLIRPLRGTLELFGTNPQGASRMVGYVPQHTLYDPQFPIQVRDVVLTGCLEKSWGLHTKVHKQRVSAILEDLGLLALADRPFSALSGGQRQRVLVARALVGQPKMLLLDEPTANIDYESARGLETYIRSLKDNLSIVLITHDFDFLTKEVDRVLCVNRNIHVHHEGQLDAVALRALFSGHFQKLGEGKSA